NASSCTDQSQFTITYQDCSIPKGISPNGDGFNDSWDLGKHGVLDVIIYNRWGLEVYTHKNGYTNQWAGQDKSGKPLASGTYFYVINTFLGRREG
ncbi:gliding motility-associated C-terminal domain-containing protein, partial [Flavobacterium sp. NKUCC04_CG]|uniref:T9SS type B sorting domain-containing protein n=1 Tax=Flavobacterium sp. NKUCC04_CG TaxID=2842121 RepID=UPI001C5B810C